MSAGVKVCVWVEEDADRLEMRRWACAEAVRL